MASKTFALIFAWRRLQMDILVVEDEAVTAAALRGTLTALGHRVRGAEDALEAWQRLQERHIPVVLCD